MSLKCPPTSVRFPTLKSKTCEICGIRVSPNPTHKKRDPCEPSRPRPATPTKAGIRVKKKAPRVGWVPLPSEPFLEKNYCYLLWFLCFDDKHKGRGYHEVNCLTDSSNLCYSFSFIKRTDAAPTKRAIPATTNIIPSGAI